MAVRRHYLHQLIPGLRQTHGRAQRRQQRQICRKFAWGTCTEGSSCTFRHELDINKIKKILKFFHDFQNKEGCNRAECTYLHTSREEQNNLLVTGQIPRVLAESYATLADTSSSLQNLEALHRCYHHIAPSVAPIMMAGSAPLAPLLHSIPFNPVQQHCCINIRKSSTCCIY